MSPWQPESQWITQPRFTPSTICYGCRGASAGRCDVIVSHTAGHPLHCGPVLATGRGYNMAVLHVCVAKSMAALHSSPRRNNMRAALVAPLFSEGGSLPSAPHGALPLWCVLGRDKNADHDQAHMCTRAHTRTHDWAQIVTLDFRPVYTYVYQLCVHALTC